MIPAHAATQKTRRGDVQVVQRVGRCALPDRERDPGGEGDDRETGDERFPRSGGREVDPERSRRATSSGRHGTPPRLSTGSVPSFT